MSDAGRYWITPNVIPPNFLPLHVAQGRGDVWKVIAVMVAAHHCALGGGIRPFQLSWMDGPPWTMRWSAECPHTMCSKCSRNGRKLILSVLSPPSGQSSAGWVLLGAGEGW